MTEEPQALAAEMRCWQETDGMSDDARRKLWLMRKAADMIDVQQKLLSRWRVVSKGLNFGQHSGEVADYDDALASELVKLTKDTISATEFPR